MCERYTRHKLCWTTSVPLLKQEYKFLSQTRQGHDTFPLVLQDLSYNKNLGYCLKFAVNTGLDMSCGICFSLVSSTATVPLSNAANQLHITTAAAVVKKEL